MPSLKKAIAIAKNSAKELFTYRLNFIVDVAILPIILLINYYIWRTVYTYSALNTIRGYTLQMLISYYVVEMFSSLLLWSNIDEQLANQIRKGKLTAQLLKPISLFERKFYGLAGSRIVNLIFQATPILIIGIFFFGVRASWMSLWFIPVLALAYILCYLIIFITGTVAFWMQKVSGLVSLRRTIMSFLAGGFIPLTFFPVWFQNLSWFLPFQYTKFVQINVFLGIYSVNEILGIMLVQIVWIGLLYGVYKIVWRAGINKYTGVGQ